ncbi:MAG: HAD family phosphatase [Oscillibacter sp.]|nr:HAD family phosphatase [Oscillibacter sp.]
MNRYSVILLDIDGTLLDSRNEISNNTKNLLKRLEKKGVPIVLASARAPGEVELVARQADVHAPVICYDGGLILDENRSIMEDIGMEKGVALAFKAFAEGRFPDVCVSSYIYDIWVVDSQENEWVRHLAKLNRKEPLQGSLSSAVRISNHVHKFLCMGVSRRIQELKEHAEAAFPELDFLLSGTVYLEVVKKGVSKYAAMEKIRRYYNIDAGQIVAVGDYYVDIEMLRAAGMGIAMGNAPEAVKHAADRVTANNDDDGVYIALKGLRFQAVPEKSPL